MLWPHLLLPSARSRKPRIQKSLRTHRETLALWGLSVPIWGCLGTRAVLYTQQPMEAPGPEIKQLC